MNIHKNQRLRIVFLGLPIAAILLMRDGHEIIFAGICRKNAIGTFRLKKQMGQKNCYLKPDLSDPKLLQEISSLKPDLLVSWFWTKRIPMEWVKACKLGGIGAHPSLLPKYRGPDPYFWPIINGETVTGVTVHTIESQYDTGNILAQTELAIHSSWNSWELAKALDRPSLKLLRSCVQSIEKTGKMITHPQNEKEASFADFPSEEKGEIHWNWSTQKILLTIRAYSPVPGAFSEIYGKRVYILKAESTSEFPKNLHSGECVIYKDKCIVKTKDGAIEIIRAEMDEKIIENSHITLLFSPKSLLEEQL